MAKVEVVKSENAGKPNYVWIIGGIILFLAIVIIFAIISDDSGGNNSNGSSEAIRNIESNLKSNPTELSNLVFTLSNFTIKGSGKVLSANCKEVENDGNGRYLLQCSIRYNPKDKNNSTDLTKENTVTVMAVFLKNDSKTYYKKYERYSYKDTLKSKSCWGKDKSYGLSC